MLSRIVGLDPGKTSGLIRFSIENNQIYCIESYELNLRGIGLFLQKKEYDYLAYEIANKFQASGHISSEVIGIAEFFSYRIPMAPISQSSHKKLITRDVLKKAGLYVPGTHAKDAAGVALFAALQWKLIDPWFLALEGS